MSEPNQEEDDGGVVVKFETTAQRDEREDAEYHQAVQEEAFEMLSRASDLCRERGVAGIVICVAFADGTYGQMMPKLCTDIGHLIAATGTAFSDLTRKNLTEDL